MAVILVLIKQLVILPPGIANALKKQSFKWLLQLGLKLGKQRLINYIKYKIRIPIIIKFYSNL